ncbi:COG1361 S-layer family protein [Natrinema caseinilyticum]|uniref:COG1361 S-layer family protein n=1 Tax=Natrinema caseinilyticum TaxID=2961570 RepID=UPI0020C3FA08|nr:hypothetical protein [Natrinema caseinilyticum]
MTGQAGGSSHRSRRRVALAGCLLVALLLSVGGLVPVSGSTAAPALQNDQPGNDTRANDTVPTTPDGQLAPFNETTPGADVGPAPRVPTGGDGAAARADASATDTGRVQPPDDNLTVTVADNQSVRAGNAASVVLEVENDGDEEATDIVVTLEPPAGALTLGSPAAPQPSQSVYIEDIWPGDTETIDVDIAAADVEPGTYPLYARVQYTIDEDDDDDDDDDDDGDDEDDDDDDDDDNETVVTGGPSVLGLPVTESQPFDVTPVDGDIPVDGEGIYEVRITNDGNETVTGAVAVMNVSPPLTSESPTAYIGPLESGESETVRFPLESSTDAIETTASATLSITYDTGTGERTSTDPMAIPVSIADTNEETDVDSLAPFALVGVVLLLAAVWWIRRR